VGNGDYDLGIRGLGVYGMMCRGVETRGLSDGRGREPWRRYILRNTRSENMPVDYSISHTADCIVCHPTTQSHPLVSLLPRLFREVLRSICVPPLHCAVHRSAEQGNEVGICAHPRNHEGYNPHP
jgi:hypothetical protein